MPVNMYDERFKISIAYSESDKQFFLEIVHAGIERGLISLASALGDKIKTVKFTSIDLSVGGQGQNLVPEVQSRGTEMSAQGLGHVSSAGI